METKGKSIECISLKFFETLQERFPWKLCYYFMIITVLGAVKEKMGSSSVLGISFSKEINYQLSPL